MRAQQCAIARVTVETIAPFAVGTGGGDDLDDALFVTDASGLPSIPGSSIAGVLRHGFTADRANALFGYQHGDQGATSSIHVSWAHVHDAQDRPVSFGGAVGGLEAGHAMRSAEDHALLSMLMAGVLRDHVRIDHRGTAADRGKFDETLIPRGARFTFELRVDGSCRLSNPGEILVELVNAIAAPTFRFGGRTRRGYGMLRVVRVYGRAFDFLREQDRKAWTEVPRCLHAPLQRALPSWELNAFGWGPHGTQDTSKEIANKDRKSAELQLKPEDYWIFGGGEPVRSSHLRDGKPKDMLPKTEVEIRWQKGVGGKEVATIVPSDKWSNLVPASSVKGALRHRVAFHARRIRKDWAELNPRREEPLEALALFGFDKGSDRLGEGLAGSIFVGDTSVSREDAKGPKDGSLDHVSLDRFTGGPMDGMLFCEAPLYQGEIRVPVTVDFRGLSAACELLAAEDPKSLEKRCRQALSAALDDLLNGNLAIGGGANRGHGYVRGRLLDLESKAKDTTPTLWLDAEGTV